MDSIHILLIESDKVLGSTFMKALRHSGYHVYQAQTAQAALNAADAHWPDLVILELQLVGHDGVEFLHEFRSYPEWQSVPIIIMSHFAAGVFGQAQVVLQRDFGVKACLYKPRTSLIQLLRTVREVLGA